MNRLLRTLVNHTAEQIAFRPVQRFSRRTRVHIARHTRMRCPARLLIERQSQPLPALLTVDESMLRLLEEGTLRLAGQSAAWVWQSAVEPSDVDPLYVYAYHDLSWFVACFRHPAASVELKHRLRCWLDAYLSNPPRTASHFWDPYPLSTRILNLIALQSDPDAPNIDEKYLVSAIAHWLRALKVQTERHLQGNHLLRYRAALLLARAALGNVQKHATVAAWRALADEAELQFEPDGAHEERTPSYHVQCTLDLLYVLALANRVHAPGDAVQRVERVAIRAVSALDVLCHEDGLVAAFGDSAPSITPSRTSIRALAERTLALAAPAADSGEAVWRHTPLNYAGYSKINLGRSTAYLNWGRFGAAHQPGHAHADLFAFELDIDGQRVIVDPGAHSYHDSYWRQRSRTALEHNTPALSSPDQAELWSRFRCGWRPRVLAAEWRNMDTKLMFCGVAEAFGPNAKARVERAIEFGLRAIDVCDTVSNANRFSVALTLNPELQLDRTGERSVLVRTARRTLKITTFDGELAVTPGWVSGALGQPQPAARLVLRATDARLRWRLDISP